jgi:hypothetical protein
MTHQSTCTRSLRYDCSHYSIKLYRCRYRYWVGVEKAIGEYVRSGSGVIQVHGLVVSTSDEQRAILVEVGRIHAVLLSHVNHIACQYQLHHDALACQYQQSDWLRERAE